MSKRPDVEFWATMEAVSPDIKPTDIKVAKSAVGLQYIRFTACLQAFVEVYNRNKRKWKPGFIKTMIAAPLVQELITNGGLPGEAGHPCPDAAQPVLERICTINPMNVSHYVKSFQWKNGDKYLYGTIETASALGDSPGTRLMAQVLQGICVSFSARTIVPQKKMPDGSIEVLGPGRLISYDWVYGPSHKEAYQDKSVKVDLIVKDTFDVNYANESALYCDLIQQATESFTDEILKSSTNVNYVLDSYDPLLESARVDKNGMFTCNTKEGEQLFIPTEENFRREIKNFMLGIR